MHDKGQTGGLLRNFCAMVKTQISKSVKIIRSDNDLELMSKPMLHYYNNNGIVHQTSMVNTPQQNERVERKHRHILEVARALWFQASLPIEFWGEYVLIATNLINRTLTATVQNKTPYDFLFHKKHDYSHIRIFGCLCYAHTKPSDKFAPRSRRCVFLGYPSGRKDGECSIWKPMSVVCLGMCVSMKLFSHTPHISSLLQPPCCPPCVGTGQALPSDAPETEGYDAPVSTLAPGMSTICRHLRRFHRHHHYWFLPRMSPRRLCHPSWVVGNAKKNRHPLCRSMCHTVQATTLQHHPHPPLALVVPGILLAIMYLVLHFLLHILIFWMQLLLAPSRALIRPHPAIQSGVRP